jgi:hypothetical protein
MRDLYNNLLVKRAISPVVVTDNTAQVSQIIDRQDAEAVLFLIDTGTLADADATFAVLLEEGDDAALADAATVSDTNTVGTQTLAAFTFASDDNVRKLGYIGDKRYLRLTITPTNNSGNAPISAMCVLGRLRGLAASIPTA